MKKEKVKKINNIIHQSNLGQTNKECTCLQWMKQIKLKKKSSIRSNQNKKI